MGDTRVGAPEGGISSRPPADLLIPAPAHWPRLVPTDAPVLRNELWHGLRNFDTGTWLVAIFDSSDRLKIVAQQTYVVDDFGSLVALEGVAEDANNAYWHSSFGIDAAADAWWDQRIADAGHARAQRQLDHRTRSLLRPLPVTVEIVTEPPHPLCVASIVVGPDDRQDAPLYSLHFHHEHPVVVTHAQLCAMALAASQLVKATTPRGRLQ